MSRVGKHPTFVGDFTVAVLRLPLFLRSSTVAPRAGRWSRTKNVIIPPHACQKFHCIPAPNPLPSSELCEDQPPPKTEPDLPAEKTARTNCVLTLFEIK